MLTESIWALGELPACWVLTCTHVEGGGGRVREVQHSFHLTGRGTRLFVLSNLPVPVDLPMELYKEPIYICVKIYVCVYIYIYLTTGT